jgi:hypothetical protein
MCALQHPHLDIRITVDSNKAVSRFVINDSVGNDTESRSFQEFASVYCGQHVKSGCKVRITNIKKHCTFCMGYVIFDDFIRNLLTQTSRKLFSITLVRRERVHQATPLFEMFILCYNIIYLSFINLYIAVNLLYYQSIINHTDNSAR